MPSVHSTATVAALPSRADPVVGLLQSAGIEEYLIAIVFFCVGLFLIYDGFDKWRVMRLLMDTPLSRLRSVAVGQAKIRGTAKAADRVFDRPFSDGTCLYANWEIQEWDSDDDEWETVESGTLSAPFDLDDGTGRIRVEPEDGTTWELSDACEYRREVGGREQEPPAIAEFLRTHTDEGLPSKGILFGESRRYVETVLLPDDEVMVFGGVSDRDGDGPDLVVRRDTASGRFLVSDLVDGGLARRYRYYSPAEMLVGLVLSAGTLYFLVSWLT